MKLDLQTPVKKMVPVDALLNLQHTQNMSPLSSKPPCAACKFQRRKCIPECIFAPYFPPEDHQKFINVHKVFGASNVSKILSDLSPALRADAARSLVYEAEYRLQEPVYGCVGLVAHLQEKLQQLQVDIANAKMELASLNNVAPLPPPPTPPVVMQPTSSFPQQYAYGQMMYHNPSSSSLPYTSLEPSSMMGAGSSTRQYGAGGGFIRMGIHEIEGGPSLALGVNNGNQIQQHVDEGLQADQLVMRSEEKHTEQVLETQR